MQKNGIVAISGYFDPIHGGHLDHIEKAKKLSGFLLVIAGTEEQCDAKHEREWGIRGHFLSWSEKVRILKCFGADLVVPNIDTDGTCAKTLLYHKPNVFAKGAEYNLDNMPISEIEACKQIGCQIIFGVGDRINRSSDFWKLLKVTQNP